MQGPVASRFPESEMSIIALRTPDSRFDNLPDFPFPPHYVDDLPGYEGLRAHYLDEGPRGGHVFLCLHGQPTWSYLYRKMIPVFVRAGGRVIAPDFFGFGRSDKPVADEVYDFGFHRRFLLALIDRLDLSAVTLVVQDWGGLLGLTLPVDRPNLARRLIVMNTGIATGQSPGPGFEAWRAYSRSRPDLDIGSLMARAEPRLSPAECAAYDAPFPDIRYKAGVWRFPELVMTSPEMEGVEVSKRAQRFWAEEWAGPTFMAIGVQDPVLGPPGMKALAAGIRGCPPPLELPQAGHFVQEYGDEVAEHALAAFGDAPAP